MSFAVVNVEEQAWDEWRPGVRTRNWSAEIDGARELHVGEQWFDPGMGVPPHWHTYEEHLIILEGEMELTVDGETRRCAAPSCCILHPRAVHQFIAVGDRPLHILGAIASPIHETFFASFAENEAIRQYEADVPEGARRKVRIDPETREAVPVS